MKNYGIDIKEFRKWLIKNVGERCPEYNKDCFVCKSWKLYDKMKTYVEFCEDLEKAL